MEWLVSMLAIGPKVQVINPDQDDGFLRAIKIRSTPSFGEEVKPESPRRIILRHLKDHLGSMNKNTSQGQIHHLLRSFLLLASI
jgi:hypothetical protein